MKSSKADAELWLDQAGNDLKYAQYTVRGEYHAQACFNAQQVAEKALMAMVYLRGERYVTGHSNRTARFRPGVDIS